MTEPRPLSPMPPNSRNPGRPRLIVPPAFFILIAAVGALFMVIGTGAAIAATSPQTRLPATLSGVVNTPSGPAAGAVVQVQGTPLSTRADDSGAFTLTGIDAQPPIVLTAWSPDHYVGWIAVDPGAADWQGGDHLVITLKPLPTYDNHDYDWFSFEGVEGTASCGLCHREYDEWLADQHSQAAVNHRFITMYKGTNVDGEQSPPIKWGSQGQALPPDPDQPYYGPGFMLDNPGRAGNCATCHTPLASKSPNDQNCGWSGCHTSLTIERSNGFIKPAAMPLSLSGDAAEGITCDFCHKIGGVILDPHTQLPLPDMPGILSYRLYRPVEGEQVFFGTVLDVNRRVSYLPLESESAFCAPCHYGVFGGVVGVGTVTGGTVIYNSYGEWLDSPYSDPETGLTCQDCHMLPSEANWFVFPDRGGLTRDYVTLHNHTMPGAADETLLQNAVTMVSTAERSGDRVEVEVSITNDQTGHHVPTDAPIRSMILVVEARDSGGTLLALREGPVNPAYSGEYGGQPGKTFAKVLRDDWTGETPTGAYWRPVTIVEDSRLAAFQTDTTRYIFEAPPGEAVTVEVRLLFRRAFAELAAQKGWDDPDILMESETIQLPAR